MTKVNQTAYALICRMAAHANQTEGLWVYLVRGFVAKCATLWLRLVVRIEELILDRKVK